jgi:carbon starvation protein CstA
MLKGGRGGSNPSGMIGVYTLNAALQDMGLGAPPVYTFIAARLPVWLLGQPRDSINGIHLVMAAVVSRLAGGCSSWVLIAGGLLPQPWDTSSPRD